MFAHLVPLQPVPIVTAPIRFDDGAAYERFMGRWSQLAGRAFLDWLALPAGLRWLDVGCGNGAFTELVQKGAAPAAVDGIDPSAGQLAYARAQPSLRDVQFHQGDAMALPFGSAHFDVAVMPLVIFFLPEPARGVAEMTRVVTPGGVVAAYAWDMPGGGFPYHVLLTEMREMGMEVPEPPSSDVSRLDRLQELWTKAHLLSVATRGIVVERTFQGFGDYWETIQGAPSVGAKLRGMPAPQVAELQARLRAKLQAKADGTITYSARANAIQGQVAS